MEGRGSDGIMEEKGMGSMNATVEVERKTSHQCFSVFEEGVGCHALWYSDFT